MSDKKEIFPSLIIGKYQITEHAEKIIEILELNVEIKEDVIILKSPKKNSSKAHKKFYEEFYNYYQRRK